MKTKLFLVLFLGGLFSYGLAACSSDGGSSADGGGASAGTIVNNPRPPSSATVANPFPDFEANLTIEALTAVENLDGSAEKEEPSTDNPVLRYWELFLKGSMMAAEEYAFALSAFGEVLADQMNTDGKTPGDTLQSVFLAEYELFGTQAPWEVAFVLYAQDENYVFYSGRNTNTGLYQWFYLKKIDEDRGGFVYVDPALLDEEGEGSSSGANLRFTALAFDFTDSSKNRLVLATDARRPSAGTTAKFEGMRTNQQCDVSSAEYLVEYRGATEQAHFLASWNETTSQVCLGVYGREAASSTTIVRTYQFTGPEIVPGDLPTRDTCTLTETGWGSPLTTDDLPKTATPLEFYNAAGEPLTPTFIDGLLDASGGF